MNPGGIDPSETFGTIFVGAGISAGWAAKGHCEKGLWTFVLERRRMVTHIPNYPTRHQDPLDLPNRNSISWGERKKHHKKLQVAWARIVQPANSKKAYFHNLKTTL